MPRSGTGVLTRSSLPQHPDDGPTDRNSVGANPSFGRMTDGPLIRPAAPREASLLSELAVRSKSHWGYDADFLAACRVELTVDPRSCDGVRTWVAVRDDRAVGFYHLAGDPPVGELADLFVDPPWIGTGVGRALIEHAIAQGRGLGFERLTLDADPGAEAFYLRAGAERVGQVPSGSIPGRLLPRMELRLTA